MLGRAGKCKPSLDIILTVANFYQTWFHPDGGGEEIRGERLTISDDVPKAPAALSAGFPHAHCRHQRAPYHEQTRMPWDAIVIILPLNTQHLDPHSRAKH